MGKFLSVDYWWAASATISLDSPMPPETAKGKFQGNSVKRRSQKQNTSY